MIFSQDVKVLVLPNHQHTLKIGKELVSETSENLHTLTRLSAPQNYSYFAFCRRESLKALNFKAFLILLHLLHGMGSFLRS